MNNNNRLKRKKNYSLVIFITILFISFIFLNISSGLLFNRQKADFTDGGKFTLSETSEKIIKETKSPVYVRFYLSSAVSRDYPALYQYSQFVLRWLENYQNLNPAKLLVEIRNPEPYSKTAEEAKKVGLESLLSADGQTELYFGASFSNDNGDTMVIPQFIPGRMSYLENDISRIISQINNPLRSKVGLVSGSLPILNRSYGETTAEWSFLSQLRTFYDVVSVSADTAQIPIDIETLIVVNPPKIHPLFSYALDQYLLRGGRILLFIDPDSEVEAEIFGTASAGTPDINKLLHNWGLNFNNDKVVGDISISETFVDNTPNGSRLRNYPLWIELGKNNINQQNPISSGLNKINLKSPGNIEILPDFKTAQAQPLLITSAKGGSIDAETARFSDKNTVIEQYHNTKQQYTLAVLVEGKFDSIYPDNLLAGTGFEENMLPFLPSSPNEGKVLVVADTDILNDENWVNDNLSIGQGAFDIAPTAQNGDFVLHATDYLTGNTEVLGIVNKTILQNQKSIAQEIYAQALQPKASEYEAIKRLLLEKERFVAYWKNAVKKNRTTLTMPVIRQLEQSRQEIGQLQEKLKYIKYQIRTEASHRTDIIIWLNLVIIPAVIIFIIWIINMLLSIRHHRKIREIINEYKIS